MARQTGRRQRWLMASALVLGMVATMLAALTGTPGPITQAHAASPGDWTITGDPLVPRYATATEDQVAVRLVGGLVLLMGGFTSYTGVLYRVPTADCEFYDPATGQWTTAAPMNHKRGGQAAVVLPDTRVLVSGGGQTSSATAEIYSHTANTWTDVASMTTERYYHSLFALPNGKVLAVGGRTSVINGSYISSAELYDLNANTWTSVQSMTDQALATVQLADGTVLAIHPGGSSETFNPATNTWQPAGSLNIARDRGFIAKLLPNGKVLLIGGEIGGNTDPAKRTELYDPTTRQWTLSKPLYQSRAYPNAFVLVNGTALVFGGTYYSTTGNTSGYPVSSFETVDLTTYTSSPTTSKTDDALGTTVLLANSDILSIGFVERNGRVHHSTRYNGPTALAKLTFDTGNAHGDLTLDFGQVVAGTPSPVKKSVTVTNSGGGAITVMQVQLPSGGPVYVYENTAPNDCVNKTLQQGQSCTVTVGFQPTAGTQYNGQLAITTNASSNATTTIPLYGSGSSGFAPSSFTFGSIAVGSTSSASRSTFTNNRTTPITITSVGPSYATTSQGTNANDFALASTTCTTGLTLQPQQSCAIGLTFHPSTAGQETGELDVGLNDGTLLIAGIAGVGSGDNLPKLAPSPASPQFAATPINSQPNGTGTDYRRFIPVVVTNAGREAMQMQTLGNSFCIQEGAANCTQSYTASGFYVYDTSDCDGKVLQPGDSCLVTLGFAPNPGTTGTRSATLKVTASSAGGYAVPAQNPTLIPISGVATTSATQILGIQHGGIILFQSPQAVGGSEQYGVDLYNYGNAPLTIYSVNIARSSLNGTDFQLGTNCNNIVLQSNTGCDTTITFTPTRVGTRYATVDVRSSDPYGGGDVGDGIRAVATGTISATIDTSSLGYGALIAQNGGTLSGLNQDIVLRNNGQAPVIGAGAGNLINSNGGSVINAGAYNVVHANTASTNYTIDYANSTCAQVSSLETNQTCTVRIQFAPTVTGTLPAQLQISGLNDNATHTTPLTGDGANAFPTIDNLSAPNGTTAGGTSLTINGTGFLSGAQVYFGAVGGPGVTPSNVSGTGVTLTTPALPAGDYDVTVVNSDGHGSNVGRYHAVPPNFVPTVAPHATVAPAISMPQTQPNSGQHPTPPPMTGSAMPTATPLPQPGRH